MGANAAIVFLGEGLPKDALRDAPPPDPAASAALAASVLGAPVVEARRSPLAESTWPREEMIGTASCPDFDLVCFSPLALDRPGDLTAWIEQVSPTGSAYGFFMHSVVDFCAMAVWEHGTLRRSLSLAPDSGIMEDLGERYDFEGPYWNGDHSIHYYAPDYPFPFHPLNLGEAALNAWFGFHLEGPPDTEVDAWAFEIPCYRRAALWQGGRHVCSSRSAAQRRGGGRADVRRPVVQVRALLGPLAERRRQRRPRLPEPVVAGDVH
jgi:hypothetical protein